MANKTIVTAEPNKPDLFITREFDAPRELVFKAHTDPDQYCQWVGRNDLEMSVQKLDAFDGGAFEFTHTRGGHSYRFFGVYHEVLQNSDGREATLLRMARPYVTVWLELKALKAHPDFQGEVDRDALTLLLRHNCVPAPFSIYKGISKLMPGHFVRLTLTNSDEARRAHPQPYWRQNDAVEGGIQNPFLGSEAEAIALLEGRLSESIADQMLADVPLGAFVSGGVDSSTIVALMQAQSQRPVRTFTIGFDESGYDEATHAKAVADHLGTDHTELYVRPEKSFIL